jgi:hypothetical protein
MTCLNALKGKGDGQAARADIIRHFKGLRLKLK